MTLKRLPAALTAIALAAASVVLHAEELPPVLQALQKQGITIARPKPLVDSSLQPLAPIPPVVATQLDANAKLMMSLGMQATPGVVWRDAKGAIQKRTGAPESALTEILGAK